jgi:Tfp pilus assembly protein PilX
MPVNSRGSILALVVVFMMVFSIIGIATIESTCYQEIQANAEINVYRANLLADAGLEWGKLWISSSCVIQNTFPENINGSNIIIVASNQTVGPTPRGYYTTGIYPLPGNDVSLINPALSSSGTYVITTTATITGTMDTVTCKTIEVYLCRSSSFTPAGPMQSVRNGHTATLLPNGKVLIAGGMDNTGFSVTSAELYDPAANTFTATNPMNFPRAGHTSTLLLNNSQVLITGGFYQSSCYNSAELYNIASGQFTMTGNMTETRATNTATLITGAGSQTGQVMIVSGQGGDGQVGDNSLDFYSPAGSFMPPNPAVTIATAVEYQTATTLSSAYNFNVLIAGGQSGVATSAAQVYNISISTFNPPINMLTPRYYHAASLMSGAGQVLITGGMSASGNPMSISEIYDPGSNSFFYPNGILNPLSMNDDRALHTSTLLGNGKVLVVGGSSDSGVVLATAELYDPSASGFFYTGSMAAPRSGHTATKLNNGVVLVAGGAVTPSAELYGALAGNYVGNTYAEYPTTRVQP